MPSNDYNIMMDLPEEIEWESEPEEKNLSVKKPNRLVPVYGMGGTHMGANPKHISAEPEGEVPSFTQIRERFIKGGLDTYGLINELKRLVRIGAIEMSPKEIKAIVDAETRLAETVVKLSDIEGQVKGLQPTDDKTIVLQILNQTYNVLSDKFQQVRRLEDEKEVIDAEYVETTNMPESVSAEHQELLKKFNDKK
jgi:hypothetical protein